MTARQLAEAAGLDWAVHRDQWLTTRALELLVADGSVIRPVAGIKTGQAKHQRPSEYLAASHSLAKFNRASGR